ncbi:MAG: cell surface protein SprA, partial [Bacteroidia bacterium]|nr:cell surface protein SprA [Bacteroidia bacterium]
AESADPAEPLADGDLRLFVRIGADFVSNYYEYELPLVITNPGTTDPELIWPEINDLDISLERLVQVKINRDQANAPFNVPYSEPDGSRTITVTGTPNLANVKTIMIGIRNPKRTSGTPTDDGRSKCAEIWVNELRLTDFEEKGGWAANARITAKLASLGTVTLTGNRKTIGFGGIEQTLNERSRSNDIGYEVAAQLKMDEFLPENTGLSIPMYFGYSEQFSNPQYNPLQPDVELETALSTLNSEDKAELKKIAQDYTRRKSLNFTNVKKNKVNPTSKSRIYDISNFDFTYAYSETFHRDINTEFDRIKTYKGAIGYNYNQQPKSYKPFNGIGSGKTLRPIKDFNFSLRPTALTFRTDLDRQYGERLLRNNTEFVAAIDTTFNKFFNWSRQYGMQWDLTKSIKLDFNANNQSRIDEPPGRIDTKTERDSIIENIKNFGRNTNYSHQGNATYNVPLNKFPLLNFINVNTKYGFDYSWTAAPLTRNSLNTLEPNSFGNTIQNSNTKQINTSLSMPTLYNKLPFYKNLNKPRRKGGSKNSKPPENTKDGGEEGDKKEEKKKKKSEGPKQVSPIVKHLVNFVFSVKNISVNYSETNGTSLPGYIRQSEILGMDLSQNSPGIPFVFGSQSDIRFDAANGGWLSDDTLLNVQYSKNFQQNLTGRANIEPIPGFRIDLNANRSFSRTNNEYFRYNPDPLVQDWESFTPQEQGNFSMSFLTWNTAFASQSLENSDLFETFNRNRVI